MTRRIFIPEIQAAVAAEFRVAPYDLVSDHRGDDNVARARQVAMALSARHSPVSLAVIGRIFRRDHSTVSYARARIAELRQYDRRLDASVKRIERRLARLPEPGEEPPETQLAFLHGPLFDWSGEAAHA